MRFSLWAVGLMAVASGLSGCGKDGGGENAPGPSAKDLVAADVATFKKMNDADLVTYDGNNNHIFSKVFGGASSQDLINYLDLRVHDYAFKSDLSVSSRGLGLMDGWADSGPHVIALNYGAQLWLEAAIEGVQALYSNRGAAPVEVTSTRVGLIVLTQYYPQLQSLARQSILLHEARHSDCTGGLPKSNIVKIKEALRQKDNEAANALFGRCGHAHVICPSGIYSGMAACDSESWGAYAVGAVYARAMAANASTK